MSTHSESARLRAERLDVGYGDHTVVKQLDFAVQDGAITTIIGPNGCGKSTLLRAMGRLLKPQSGQVVLDGKQIHTMNTRDVATTLAMLPQSPLAPEGLIVRDLVSRGRHPRQSWLRQWSKDDEAHVNETLAWTSMTDLADQPIDELSGGQRQRAWIAMALAQDTDLLLLDEPTTYLDLSHQIEVLDLVRTLNRRRARTIVMVLHDLNLAARYSDRLVAMRDGRLVAEGSPGEVLTTQMLRDTFNLDAQIAHDPVTGRPMVIPIGSLAEPAAELSEDGPPEEGRELLTTRPTSGQSALG